MLLIHKNFISEIACIEFYINQLSMYDVLRLLYDIECHHIDFQKRILILTLISKYS